MDIRSRASKFRVGQGSSEQDDNLQSNTSYASANSKPGPSSVPNYTYSSAGKKLRMELDSSNLSKPSTSFAGINKPQYEFDMRNIGSKPMPCSTQKLTPAKVSSPRNKRNSGILHRVTSSVSGLFSNVSWSEWLKGPDTSMSNEEIENEANFDPDLEHASVQPCNLEEKNENNSFNQLYPEEGVTEFNDSKEGLKTLTTQESFSKIKPSISMNPDVSTYRRASHIFSTPGSPLNTVKGGHFELSISPDFMQRDTTLPTTLPTTLEEIWDTKESNASNSRYPSSRKRLRDTSKDESIERDKDINSSRRVSFAALQTFSEQSEEESVESVKRKRPRFSVSTFGSPINSNLTEEEEPTYSIFYPGKIAYGGASNQQIKRARIIPKKMCPRTPTSASYNNEDYSDGGLSLAAKRILSCIDKISTPLSDSKRMFSVANSRELSFDTSSYVADFHKHRPSLRTHAISTPPIAKLLTPSKAKINKNFSSLVKPKNSEAHCSKDVNDQSKSVIPISQDLTFKNFSSYLDSTPKLSTISTSEILPFTFTPNTGIFKISGVDLEKRKTELEPTNQGGNSTKTTSSTGYFEAEEADDQVFSQCYVVEKDVEYNFSDPEIVSSSSGALVPLSVEDIEFKFSQPLETDCLSSSPAKSCGTDFKCADKFKPAEDIWECGTCLLHNVKSKSKCAACETPMPVPSTLQTGKPLTFSMTKTYFGSEDPFKRLAVPLWDCPTCLLQNKEEEVNCVACFTSRPKSESASCGNTTLITTSDKDKFPSNWGDSFKPAEGSWECQLCFLRNKESALKCAACEMAKPNLCSTETNKPLDKAPIDSVQNSWGDAFLPSKGSWECDSCFLQNEEKSLNCVACNSAKPKCTKASIESKNEKIGRKENLNSSRSAFHGFQEKIYQNNLKNTWTCTWCITINKSTDELCFGCKGIKELACSSRNSSFTGAGSDSFKTKDEWVCETCLVRNKQSVPKCTSCDSPRLQLSSSTIVSEALTGNFKFGVSKKSTPATTVSLISTFSQPASVIESTSELSKEPTATSVTLAPSIDSAKSAGSNSTTIEMLLSQKSPSTTTVATPAISFFTPPVKTQETKTTSIPAATVENSEPKKPLFQFSFSAPAASEKLETKLEFPKISSNASTGLKRPSDSISEPFAKVNPSTFSFFNKDSTSSTTSTTPFSLPPAIKEASSIASNNNTPSSSLFAFGQQTTKSSSTAFNFGEATSKTSSATFNFGGSSTPILKFGQPNSKIQPQSTKPPEPAAPSFLNIERPKANPFAASSSAAGPQKRLIKRAIRRNKVSNS